MAISAKPSHGAPWDNWAADIDTEARKIAGKVDAATQRAGLRLAGGGSAAAITGPWSLHARIATRFPRKPTRVRVHVWNRDVKASGTALTTGALAFAGFYIGKAALDAAGAPTSAFQAAPTQLSGSFSTPADGATENVTPWTTVDLPAGEDLLLSYGMRGPSGQTYVRSVGAMWFIALTTGDDLAAAASTVAPTGMSSTGTTWFDMWIEYETADGASHGLLIGDSLTAGNMGTFPYRDGYAGISSVALGYAATNASWSGTSIAGDWGAASPKWPSISTVTKPTWIDIGLGSNDLANAQTLAQLQASIGTLIGTVRGYHPGVPIYVRTIMPRGFTGQIETDRLAFNAWLRARPFGIAGYFDVATLVTDTATGNTLLAAYNGGDGTHLNTAGYALISTACRPPLKFVPSSAIV